MIQISRCNGYNRRLRGMTLVELLIAVVIVGIIAAIAYPSYSNHAITAHRTVALSDISRIQLELETTYNGGYDWNGIISGGVVQFVIRTQTASHFPSQAQQQQHIQLQQPQNLIVDKMGTAAFRAAKIKK